MRPRPPEVSVVVPAYNEEATVRRTLPRLRSALEASGLSHEVVVVDHGSTDRTAPESRPWVDRVIDGSGASSIAALRNLGLRETSGEAVVFLDADVLVSDAWARRLPGALEELREEPRRVTGSWVGISPEAAWIERNWFEPLVRSEAERTHMNSAHLIAGRPFLEEIGGFDESLETGEDYDLSRRAIASGGRVVDDGDLAVAHLGFPRTLRAFVRREAWHGRSDFASLSAVASSRVAVATLVFLAAHSATAAGVVLGRPWLTVGGAGVVAAVCLGSAVFKFSGQGAGTVLSGTAVYYVYFWARAGALVSALLVPSRRRTRSR